MHTRGDGYAGKPNPMPSKYCSETRDFRFGFFIKFQFYSSRDIPLWSVGRHLRRGVSLSALDNLFSCFRCCRHVSALFTDRDKNQLRAECWINICHGKRLLRVVWYRWVACWQLKWKPLDVHRVPVALLQQFSFSSSLSHPLPWLANLQAKAKIWNKCSSATQAAELFWKIVYEFRLQVALIEIH